MLQGQTQGSRWTWLDMICLIFNPGHVETITHPTSRPDAWRSSIACRLPESGWSSCRAGGPWRNCFPQADLMPSSRSWNSRGPSLRAATLSGRRSRKNTGKALGDDGAVRLLSTRSSGPNPRCDRPGIRRNAVDAGPQNRRCGTGQHVTLTAGRRARQPWASAAEGPGARARASTMKSGS